MSSNDRVESKNEPVLAFRFTEDDRAELAKLEPGQVVRVERKPEGHDRERTIIYFFHCKLIVKVGTD